MSAQNTEKDLRRLKGRLALLFAAAAAVIIGGTALYYNNYRGTIERDKEELISSVAQSKIAQIETWRAQRLNDINSLLDSPTAVYISRLAANPGDRENSALLRRRLDAFISNNRYTAAYLADASGRILLAAGKFPASLCPAAKTLINCLTVSSGPVMGDIHRSPSGEPGIHTAGLAAQSPAGKKIFLVTSSDPGVYIYLLTQAWPTNTQTAETLLVRRDGADVLYLNELRHRKNTALNLRQPLSQENLPTTAAVKGFKGIMSGIDYRGKRVLAYTSTVSGSNWAVVTKIDESEIFADLRRTSALLFLLAIALLAAAGAWAAMLFQRQTTEYLQTIKKAEAALQVSEYIFREFMEHSPIYVFFKDENLRAIHLSRNYEAMLGRPLGELIGKTMDELFPSELAKSMAADDMRILKEGKKVVVEEELNGRHYTTTKFPISLEGGPRYLAGFTIDITESKRAGLELQRLNRDLIEKTHEMENFLYITTHDLRGPLVNIQGFSQNVERYSRELKEALSPAPIPTRIKDVVVKITGEQIPGALKLVLQNSRRMDALISALLKVSRIGRVEMKPETLDMNGLLEKISGSMLCQLEAAGGKIECGNLPRCKADPLTVSQLFSNLLDNAIKYRHKDRALMVNVTGEVKGGMAVYAVADNGSGIPEADLHRIWNVFFRRGNAPETEGEGIGLPMVRRIAEKNGGGVRAESREGEGSVFYVELPAAGEGEK